MRTALAYTTGYMDTATVLTRANVEFRIPDEARNRGGDSLKNRETRRSVPERGAPGPGCPERGSQR